ncbi:MAG: ATP-dependent 6-phosphofructokinase [Clostridia bacterium]|nr:ATP-dependent 6-phosphofructokinase [Clostridia bacterium]
MNIGILTSGGDAPGMNAFISNLINLAVKNNQKIFAVKFGFQGLVNNNIIPLSKKDVDNISHLGGSFIKSFRSPEFQTEKGFSKALSNYKKSKIDYLIVLGGDGSLQGSKRLTDNGVKVIFIPTTIDNDLFYTDKSLGFDSAVNCAVGQIDMIKQTMLSLNRIFICEVMGRKCADIANYCALATNANILVADQKDADFNKIITKLKSAIKDGEEAPLIVLRENILNASELARKIQDKLNIETRASILGYVQRGTSPSVYDRIYAMMLAKTTIELINKKNFNLALGVDNDKIISINLEKALTKNNRNSKINL